MQMDGDQSSNIEDRRDDGGFGGGGFGGGGFPIPMGGGGGGLFKGGFGLVAFVVIAMIMGADPGAILSDIAGGGGATYTQEPPARPASAGRTTPAAQPSDDQAQFVSRVLKSTEDVWNDIFRGMGQQYREPRLVLFRDATRTECGVGQAAMGPFYCPADQRVYLDLGFFDELARRFRVPGQFCDKGPQYRSAIFALDEEQPKLAEASKAALDKSGKLPGKIVTEIVAASVFWPAEEYHQDYYKKNPLRYNYYRSGCGRDRRLQQIWGDAAGGH